MHDASLPRMIAPVIRRGWEAILLELDGTLLTDEGVLRPKTVESLRALVERDVRVMVATGRSVGGARPILAELKLPEPAVVFNGGGLYCPQRDRLLEEHLLSDRAVARTLAFAESEGHYSVVQRFGAKFAGPPRSEDERTAAHWLEDLHVVEDGSLPRENLMRITLFSDTHTDSALLAQELDAAVDLPCYLTDFPLCALPYHRDSQLQVVDIQPPCRGKSEGLRYLLDVHGIEASRVVAVGDASNDVPMVSAAGLGVAMANSMQSLLDVADRVIGDNNSDAISELVDELFG